MENKYLEALDRISIYRFDDKYEEWDADYETVENYLQSIDNAEPSEALKELELVENWIRDRELKISNVIEPSLNTIKQTLLKAQELEALSNEYDLQPSQIREAFIVYQMFKGFNMTVGIVEKHLQVLNIIFKKRVDISVLSVCETLDEYNNSYIHKLTQEEFDLLKRYCNENKS